MIKTSLDEMLQLIGRQALQIAQLEAQNDELASELRARAEASERSDTLPPQ